MLSVNDIKNLNCFNTDKSVFDNRKTYLEIVTDNIKNELINLGLSIKEVDNKINYHIYSGKSVEFEVNDIIISVWHGNTTKWTITRIK